MLERHSGVCETHYNLAPGEVSRLADVLGARRPSHGTRFKYCFDRVQESRIDLFNATKGGDLGDTSSCGVKVSSCSVWGGFCRVIF